MRLEETLTSVLMRQVCARGVETFLRRGLEDESRETVGKVRCALLWRSREREIESREGSDEYELLLIEDSE